MRSTELGTRLRTWRERLAPSTVGLPTQPRRRARGLRREEVAQLAGLSGDYLVRLEQGRSRNPSAHVLQSLARVLRLDDEERDQLFRLAGQLPPTSGRMDRRVTPGRGRNRAWRTFMDVPGMGLLEPQTRSMVERAVVAGLHAAVIRFPRDAALASLVGDLRALSTHFAELWSTTPPGVRGAQRKTLDHAVVGLQDMTAV